MDFELETQVIPQHDGTYQASLSKDWEIWGPNGGYLCAIALRAAGHKAEIKRPVALYCHYLRVAQFAPVELRVESLGRTRRSESLRVSMHQQGKAILEAMVRTAAAGEGLEHVDVHAPSVAPPEQLPDARSLLSDGHGKRHAFWNNFDVRVLRPERFALPRTASDPSWQEWYRVHCQASFDDPFLDAGRSALLLDTMGWPAAVGPHPDSDFLAPSLDFSCWFHAPSPASDWLLVDAHSAIARDGSIFASGRVYDRQGTLLASSGSQLLCTRVPKPT